MQKCRESRSCRGLLMRFASVVALGVAASGCSSDDGPAADNGEGGSGNSEPNLPPATSVEGAPLGPSANVELTGHIFKLPQLPPPDVSELRVPDGFVITRARSQFSRPLDAGARGHPSLLAHHGRPRRGHAQALRSLGGLEHSRFRDQPARRAAGTGPLDRSTGASARRYVTRQGWILGPAAASGRSTSRLPRSSLRA